MKKLDNFIQDIKKVFNQRLKSIFIYGSKANIDTDKLSSDIDIMVVADSVTGDDLKKCAPIVKKWMGIGCPCRIFDKEKNPLPVFMGEREWFNSADVYAMEYSDIKDNHKILYGENLICSLNIKKEDLRLQCEAEMKNLLMRFRKHYLLFADNPKEINNALLAVTKTINAIFKAILRLKEIEVSKSAYANLNKICEIFDADKQFYEKLLCAKDRHCKFSKAETYKLADEAIMQLEKLLEYINNM